jgi:hypothetical protein
MNWITQLFEKFFGNDSKYFLLGAWLTALFMLIGQFWSLIGAALAFGTVYFAEKQMYGEWVVRDMKSILFGCLTSMILGILLFP